MWLTYDQASLVSDIANVVLLASLAIGVIASLVIFWMGNLKEGYLRSDVTTANSVAEKAKLEAAQASAGAASTQAELVQLRAPRTLSLEQQSLITTHVKAFAGQKFSGLVASGVPDAMQLWQALTASLGAAGWQLLPPNGIPVGAPPAGIPIAPESGITILVHVDSVQRLRPATDALVTALAREIRGVKTGVHNVHEIDREGVIVIEVGPKP